MHHLEVDF